MKNFNMRLDGSTEEVIEFIANELKTNKTDAVKQAIAFLNTAIKFYNNCSLDSISPSLLLETSVKGISKK